MNEYVTYDEFAKLDIRIAKIIRAERIPGTKKLLKLFLDVGDLGTRQVVAGIAEEYSPNDLIGKQVVYLSNLQPKKIRGEISQGMILAAGCEEGGKPVLLQPQKNVNVGSKVC